MSAGLAWALAGIALCGAELLHPGVFLLWIGLAGVATGAVTWFGDFAGSSQIWTFLVCLALLLSIPWLRHRRRPGYEGGINAADTGLIGKTCRAIAFEGAEGRVAFRDGTWLAHVVSGPSPAPGTILRITGLEGTTLLVVADATVVQP
jgi:membrane protein implicated in regulation of membrane protease activity